MVAAVVLRHPPDPATASDLGDQLGLYIAIHVALLVLLPLLGLVVWALLSGVTNRAATIARVLVVPAVAFYTAFDALVGVGAGVLAREALAMPEAMQPGAEALAARWMEIPWPLWLPGPLAQLFWIGAVVAAAMAHHRAGSPAVAVAALGTAAIFAVHPGAPGVLAMAALVVAGLTVERRSPAPHMATP